MKRYRTGNMRRGRWPVLVAVVVLLVLTIPAVAIAWDDCPKGVTELCTGACSRFIDTNGDGYCDHSQPEPAAATVATTPATTAAPSSTAPSATPSTSPTAATLASSASTSDAAQASAAVALAAVSSTTTLPPGSGGNSTGDATAAEAAGTAGAVGSEAADTAGTAEVIALPAAAAAAPTVRYNVSPIAVVFFLVYAVSFVLYKARRMRAATHRKIWNVLLLLTFLITGFLGLLLTIRLNYGLRLNPPFDMLFWHVETGIVMTLISFFHVGWHLKYYRSLLRRRSNACEDARAAARAARRACAEEENNYSPIPRQSVAGKAAGSPAGSPAWAETAPGAPPRTAASSRGPGGAL